MMHLIALLQSAQNCDGLLDCRFRYGHRLKPPLQRRILLDVFTIFIQGRRANTAQFAARQLRLQHIRRIRRTFRIARAHNGVQLVDKQNDLSLSRCDFLEKRLQPILKFAAILRSSNHRAQIHRHNPFVTQRIRYIPAHHATRQPLGNRRFTNAWLTDQHGIILCAPRQHLHHAANLIVPSNHRINFPFPSQSREVLAILLQGLEFIFRIRVRHPLRSAHLTHLFQQHRPSHALPLK